jgi:hypothetical protein
MKLTQEYSRVAAIFDKENRHPGYGDYYDIGHSPERGKYLVWIWMGGEVETSRVFDYFGSNVGDKTAHEDLWPEHYEKSFSGRFEVDTGELSVVTPYRWQHRPVPESILEALERKFHPKNIHVF